MNYCCTFFRFSFLLFAVFLVMQTHAQTPKTFSVTNPLNQQRQDELVVLKRTDLEKKLGVIPNGKCVAVSTSNHKNITVQFDDLNGDGKWEEAVFLYPFQPKETAVFTVNVSGNNSGKDAVPRAHVRLKKKNPDDSFGPVVSQEEMPLRHPATDFSKQPLPNYLTEGPAWENDKVAFRLYLDVRNNKDIYGKRVSRMVMDSVGQTVHPSYHDLHDWGMDILHVVKSLGAGALALDVPMENRTDTLIRLGGENVKKTVYQRLADGPDRAVFTLSYDWELQGKPVHIIEETSIWGGQYFYQSKVWVKGAPAGAKLVTGIADFYENVFQSFPAGNEEVIFSHGKQSENKDYLGMAIMLPKEHFAYVGSAPATDSDVLTSYLAAQDVVSGSPATFRFYVGWEKTDANFASVNYFKKLLQTQAAEWSRPVVINWMN